MPIPGLNIVKLITCNRNDIHSVNLTPVCDAQKKFMYCFSGFPGSVHDQQVFANSKLGHSLPDNPCKYLPSQHYHIIGDSALLLHHNVMVPFKDMGNLTVQQLNYNRRLSQSRQVIKNIFSLLKGCFWRLRRLECKLSNVSKVTAVLT